MSIDYNDCHAKLQEKMLLLSEVRSDTERMNNELISKDHENAQLKQTLQQMQHEMMTMKNEFDSLTQYVELKESKKLFPSD